MTTTFRQMIQAISPGWLLGDPSQNGSLDHIGARYLYAIGLELDTLGALAVEGVRKRFPTYVAPDGSTQPDGDALALIGRDRSIPQGPSEPNTSYGVRLAEWIDDLKMSGSAFTTLKQIQGYLTPNYTTLRIVNNWGVWYTMAPDFSRSLTISPRVAGVPNWNWDNKGPWQTRYTPPGLGDEPSASMFAWSRFWVVIHCNGGLPFDVGPTWGSSTWAAPNRTWGTTATPAQVAAIRNIIGAPGTGFKAAHSKCVNIIIAFDPTSFNPSAAGGAPLPDGTWGRWAHPTGSPFAGQQARLPTARYWDGPP